MARQPSLLTAFLVLGLLAAPAVAEERPTHPDELSFDPLAVEIPVPERFTLENGIVVYLLEDHELPLISVIARIRTGSNHMPGDREGMGSVFGQVQREGGTTSMTGDEIDDFLLTLHLPCDQTAPWNAASSLSILKVSSPTFLSPPETMTIRFWVGSQFEMSDSQSFEPSPPAQRPASMVVNSVAGSLRIAPRSHEGTHCGFLHW